MSRSADSILVILPAYHEEGRIGPVVQAVLKQVQQVLVVDDGSTDRTSAEAEAAGAMVVRQEPNQGKGMALRRGFDYAEENGFSAVITMDADGQHSPDELPLFVEAYAKKGADVVVGNRMTDTSDMPWVRRLTNWYMSWTLSRRARQWIPDTQNGYRLYSVDALKNVQTTSKGYAAESEILLRLALAGMNIESVPTRTIYGDEESKINPVPDTFRFFRMLWRFRREKK